MRLRRRGRFGEAIDRQLTLFEREQAALIRECDDALRAYDRAERDEAEELYGDYVDHVDSARDALLGYRYAYASTLDDEAADEYEEVFNRLARKRLPSLGLELE